MFPLSLLELLWIPIGVILTILGTLVQVTIPTAWGSDYLFSLQVGGVLLAACLGGSRVGLFSQMLYLSLGLAGIQIFSQGGGLGYLREPSFGYLLGFVPASWICGAWAFRPSPRRRKGSRQQPRFRPSNLRDLLAGSLCGLMVIHITGIVYLLVQMPWGRQLGQLLVTYSLYPLPGQLLVVLGTCLSALLLRRLLLT